MLGSQARHQPYFEVFTSCSEWVVPVDAYSMTLEACCQEDRGINMETTLHSKKKWVFNAKPAKFSRKDATKLKVWGFYIDLQSK